MGQIIIQEKKSGPLRGALRPFRGILGTLKGTWQFLKTRDPNIEDPQNRTPNFRKPPHKGYILGT